VIGEFSAACAESEPAEQLWSWGYREGYQGLWSWQYNAGGHCTDSQEVQVQGMMSIRDNTENGKIPIEVE